MLGDGYWNSGAGGICLKVPYNSFPMLVVLKTVLNRFELELHMLVCVHVL